MTLALITGASRGIGRATAQRFVREGWRVLNLARSVCDEPGVENLSLDLAAVYGSELLAESLTPRLPKSARIVLIHNAALMNKDRAQGMPVEDLRRVLALNVEVPSALNQLVIPHMQAGSAVLYVGSTLSEKAVANTFSYVTSKHAVVGMMRATCQDLAGTGIHTACICPGFTDTEMLRGHLGAQPEALRSVASASTMGRLVQPVEIAETLWWAANNPVLNGALLHANLGQRES